MAEGIVKDVRYAFRGICTRPTFSLIVVTILAFGIGANTALFSLVETVILRSLAVPHPEQLYFVANSGRAGQSGAPPYPCYRNFRNSAKSFEGMAAFSPANLIISINGQTEEVLGDYASDTYFTVLGAHPAIGRLFTSGDDELKPPVAVLSYGYWQTRFGGDPGVLGKIFYLNSLPLTMNI